jgi:hypothetical protein
MSLDELSQEIRKLKAEGINTTPLLIEYTKRYRYSFSFADIHTHSIPLALMASGAKNR